MEKDPAGIRWSRWTQMTKSEWFRKLVEIDRRLAACREPEDALRTLVQGAVKLLHPQAAVLVGHCEGSSSAQIVCSVGVHPDAAAGLPIALDHLVAAVREVLDGR